MKKIIIATHGEMAAGIKSALALIAGTMAQEIVTYALIPGKSAADFMATIEKELIQQPETQFIVMGDLYGASIVNAMLSLATYPNAVLVSGVNLSLALQILLDGADRLSTATVDEMIKEAQKGIRRLQVEEFKIEDEDF